MSKFEDRLWRDLVRKHGADLAQIERPAAKRPRRSRPRLLAGTSIGLAVAGTAAALVLSAASSPPAFAVSRNADGTVTVSLQKLAAVHQANVTLAAMGVRARVVVVSTGCTVKALPPAAVKAMQLARTMAGRAAPQAAITRFDPRKIPPGKIQVIPAYRVANSVRVARAHLIAGTVPVCISTLVAPACQPQRLLGNARLTPANPVDLHEKAAQDALKRFLARQHAIAHNSANSGSTGNSGTSSNSGTAGNSGNGGNSGPGTSTASRTQVPIPATVVDCYVRVPAGHPPVTGNSGNSGNSGTSGNS